jgi:Ca2+-binding EF-hand superfamily protein
LDKDGSGSVTKEELGAALRQFGHNVTDEHVAGLIKEVDKDNSGCLNFEEFCVLAKHHKYILATEAQLKEIFKVRSV